MTQQPEPDEPRNGLAKWREGADALDDMIVDLGVGQQELGEQMREMRAGMRAGMRDMQQTLRQHSAMHEVHKAHAARQDEKLDHLLETVTEQSGKLDRVIETQVEILRRLPDAS